MTLCWSLRARPERRGCNDDFCGLQSEITYTVPRRATTTLWSTATVPVAAAMSSMSLRANPSSTPRAMWICAIPPTPRERCRSASGIRRTTTMPSSRRLDGRPHADRGLPLPGDCVTVGLNVTTQSGAPGPRGDPHDLAAQRQVLGGAMSTVIQISPVAVTEFSPPWLADVFRGLHQTGLELVLQPVGVAPGC